MVLEALTISDHEAKQTWNDHSFPSLLVLGVIRKLHCVERPNLHRTILNGVLNGAPSASFNFGGCQGSEHE